MRYLILSDIHDNLEAFERVLSVKDSYAVDKTLILGDILGYGANPFECLKLAQQYGDELILGNHEDAVIDPSIAETFSNDAYAAIGWTRKELQKKDTEYLRSLDFIKQNDLFTIVHGSPQEPERFHYIYDGYDADKAFRYLETPICFVGHTHRPALFTEGESEGLYLKPGKIMLKKDKRYIINVGSVGQPRDGDRRLAFGIFDTEEYSIEVVRLTYDNQKAATKIKKAGLPEYLAKRLL